MCRVEHYVSCFFTGKLLYIRNCRIFDIDNERETEMCLDCGEMPCYRKQLKEIFIATVLEDNTLPVAEDSNLRSEHTVLTLVKGTVVSGNDAVWSYHTALC